MNRTTDEHFIARVYRTSAFMWAFGFLVCWAVSGLFAAGGWTLGSVLSVTILWSLEWIIRRVFVPEANGAKKALAKFTLLKLPAVAAILVLAVFLGRASFAFIIAFCAGVVLTQSVIFLKTVGMLVAQRLNG